MKPLMRLFCCLLLAACFAVFAFSGLALAQEPIIGEIRMYAGGVITSSVGYEPVDGWLYCNGQCLEADDYPDLYDVITYTFGTVEPGVFCLPDLRSRFPLGRYDYTCVDPSLPGCTLGGTGGEVSHTLTIAEMPIHTHTIYGDVFAALGAAHRVLRGGTGAANVSSDPTGGDQPHNNMPPYMTLNFIIAYTTTQITPTPTPTPTATPIFTSSLPYISAYTHTLAYSGKTLVVPVYTTFGELLISGGVLAVLSIFVLGFVFRVVHRQ